jgi:UDP-glucose 4-epimerase
MLKHLNVNPVTPKRVVVMGAGGFVGTTVVKRLREDNASVTALTRAEVDLLTNDAGRKLASILLPDDALVVVSAIAPCKDNAMLVENIAMMASVCTAVETSPPAHVVYISSDAVYADSDKPLTEYSCAEPGSLHGAMHLTREVMLKGSFSSPLAILRPSLLYGVADTHNGYGPNRFLRLATAGEDIVLFGEGEELRDHVWVEDVAEIVSRVLFHRSTGILNIATGDVVSFRKIAEIVARLTPHSIQIRNSPRVGPMPHNGYRPFDVTATHEAFPDFRYMALRDGLLKSFNRR